MKKEVFEGTRITLALPTDQADLLKGLCNNLDVDQGKAVRWMMNTCIDISEVAKNNPDCKALLKPQSVYMLDTLSEIHS